METNDFCSIIRHLNFLHGFDFLATLGDSLELQKRALVILASAASAQKYTPAGFDIPRLEDKVRAR